MLVITLWWKYQTIRNVFSSSSFTALVVSQPCSKNNAITGCLFLRALKWLIIVISNNLHHCTKVPILWNVFSLMEMWIGRRCGIKMLWVKVPGDLVKKIQVITTLTTGNILNIISFWIVVTHQGDSERHHYNYFCWNVVLHQSLHSCSLSQAW